MKSLDRGIEELKLFRLSAFNVKPAIIKRNIHTTHYEMRISETKPG